MAERQRRRALLVRLAGLRRHAENGAVAVTQAIAMLLEEPAPRDAVLMHQGSSPTAEQ
jgi:hypothetical protein